MMRKNLGFTIAAIIVLGLGIGANTAIFSVVNAVLLKPLPFAHGERLLMLSQRTVPGGGGVGRSSVPELIDYRAQSRSMDGIVEYHNMQFIFLGRAEPERVETGVVSWNFFDVFGVKPLVGRMFEPADEKPGAPAVLLLSYEYWLQKFWWRPDRRRQNISHERQTPHGDRRLAAVSPISTRKRRLHDFVGVPVSLHPEMIANRKGRMLRLFGTMKPGVTPGQAQADLSTVAATMQRDFPTAYSKDDTPKMEVTPMKAELTRDAKPTMLFLWPRQASSCSSRAPTSPT